MRGESMKDKSKKSTYSTTFGVDPIYSHLILVAAVAEMVEVAGVEPAS